jgi:hypothetical protein
MPSATDALVQTRISALVTIEIPHGADWDDVWRLREWDSGANAYAALSLTGVRLQLNIRPDFGHATLIKAMDTQNGSLVVTDAAAGEFAAGLPADQVDLLPVGTWTHVLREFRSGGWRELWRGPFLVHPGNH